MNSVQCPSDAREEVWCYSLGISLQSTLSEKSNADIKHLSYSLVWERLLLTRPPLTYSVCVCFCVSVFDEEQSCRAVLEHWYTGFIEIMSCLRISVLYLSFFCSQASASSSWMMTICTCKWLIPFAESTAMVQHHNKIKTTKEFFFI